MPELLWIFAIAVAAFSGWAVGRTIGFKKGYDLGRKDQAQSQYERLCAIRG